MRVEHLPDSLKEIRERQYVQYTSLEYIKLPTLLERIGKDAFYKCRSLRSMVIPNTVKSIAESGFSSCTSMRSYTFDEPSSLTSIGDYAFGCNEKLRSIDIPSTVTQLGKGVFSRCTSLKDLTLPTAITMVPMHLCHACSELETVQLSSETRTIGDGAFLLCGSLIDVQLPSTLKTLGGEAFSSCKALPCIYMPSNVLLGRRDPFKNCSQLIILVDAPSAVYVSAQPFLCLQDIQSIMDEWIPDNMNMAKQSVAAQKKFHMKVVTFNLSMEVSRRLFKSEMSLLHLLAYFPGSTARNMMKALVKKLPYLVHAQDKFGRAPLEIVASRMKKDMEAIQFLSDFYDEDLVWDAIRGNELPGVRADTVLECIIMTKLNVLDRKDAETQLYPFQLAATKQCCDLSVVYNLLSLRPQVLSGKW